MAQADASHGCDCIRANVFDRRRAPDKDLLSNAGIGSLCIDARRICQDSVSFRCPCRAPYRTESTRARTIADSSLNNSCFVQFRGGSSMRNFGCWQQVNEQLPRSFKMSNNSKPCNWGSCTGAACTCGCQRAKAKSQATGCACRENCKCGSTCSCKKS